MNQTLRFVCTETLTECRMQERVIHHVKGAEKIKLMYTADIEIQSITSGKSQHNNGLHIGREQVNK